MDEVRRLFSRSDEFGEGDGSAELAAQSIRTDFKDLIAMLDQQAETLAGRDERALSHILEAKAAARRGLVLSMQLIELLRAAI